MTFAPNPATGQSSLWRRGGESQLCHIAYSIPLGNLINTSECEMIKALPTNHGIGQLSLPENLP